jgi:hypothetical protein
MSGLCMNNAPCKENFIGSTRHAYCHCLPGYIGIQCENRMYFFTVFVYRIVLFFIEYFKCISNGKFMDSFMHDQGKYFECTQLNECKLRRRI